MQPGTIRRAFHQSGPLQIGLNVVRAIHTRSCVGREQLLLAFPWMDLRQLPYMHAAGYGPRFESCPSQHLAGNVVTEPFGVMLEFKTLGCEHHSLLEYILRDIRVSSCFTEPPRRLGRNVEGHVTTSMCCYLCHLDHASKFDRERRDKPNSIDSEEVLSASTNSIIVKIPTPKHISSRSDEGTNKTRQYHTQCPQQHDDRILRGKVTYLSIHP